MSRLHYLQMNGQASLPQDLDKPSPDHGSLRLSARYLKSLNKNYIIKILIILNGQIKQEGNGWIN